MPWTHDWKPDEFQYVAASPAKAREFFGVPNDAETHHSHVDQYGRTVYAVRVEHEPKAAD